MPQIGKILMKEISIARFIDGGQSGRQIKYKTLDCQEKKVI